MFRTIKNEKKQIIYRLAFDYDCDILVIGRGLTGSLLTYLLNEGNNRCIYLNMNDDLKEDETYNLDWELQRLNQIIHPEDSLTLFRETLNAIYKLDKIVTKLGGNCEYVRNPNLVYEQNQNDKSKGGFEVYPGLLTYYSGVTFNQIKLSNLINQYCESHLCQVYHSIKIKEIEVSKLAIKVKLNDHTEVTSKQLILLDEEYSPYFLIDKVVNQSFPHISRLVDFPNIYLNTGNYSILNGLIMGDVFQSILSLPQYEEQTITC